MHGHRVTSRNSGMASCSSFTSLVERARPEAFLVLRSLRQQSQTRLREAFFQLVNRRNTLLSFSFRNPHRSLRRVKLSPVGPESTSGRRWLSVSSEPIDVPRPPRASTIHATRDSSWTGFRFLQGKELPLRGSRSCLKTTVMHSEDKWVLQGRVSILQGG